MSNHESTDNRGGEILDLIYWQTMLDMASEGTLYNTYSRFEDIVGEEWPTVGVREIGRIVVDAERRLGELSISDTPWTGAFSESSEKEPELTEMTRAKYLDALAHDPEGEVPTEYLEAMLRADYPDLADGDEAV